MINTKTRQSRILLAVLVGLGLLFTVAMFASTDRMTMGFLALGLMLVMIFAKVPVAVALGVPGLLGTWAMIGFKAVRTDLRELPYNTTASWTLSVIPMFVLMATMLWRAGVTGDLYTAGRHWLGRVPGGLAVGTTFAGAGLAAVSGSTMATTYALGQIGIPEMLKAGYDRRFALGAVIVAGLPGQLIPPSIMLVLYAGIAQVPVGPQLIAGIGPGLLVAFVSAITLMSMALIWPALTSSPLRPASAGDSEIEQVSRKQRLKILVAVWPVPVIIGILTGGMFTGVLTATEAGSVAALSATLVALFRKRKERPWRLISQATAATASTVGAIFFLLMGATLLTRMLTLSGIAGEISGAVQRAEFSAIQFLLVMMVVYLFMGMFLDPLAMMLLTVPILMPTVASLGISEFQFGVFVVFMAELGILTPPVGILSYILHGITRQPEVNQGVNITLKDTFTAVAWFMPALIIIGLLIIFFPGITTFLPGRMN